MNEIVPFFSVQNAVYCFVFCFTGSKGIGNKTIITPFVVIIFLVRQLYLKIIKVGVEYVSYAIK
jgi:hypothetical protein